MLKLRRGTVASVEAADGRIARVTVELEGGSESRPAVAYPRLTGPVEVGDDVIVNVEAADLGLGSGGFDVVHCNLTRGLDRRGRRGAHVMKLNYTSLQHAVQPMEEGSDEIPPAEGIPVAVLALHGQLPCAAFALTAHAPGARVGYVQTSGRRPARRALGHGRGHARARHAGRPRDRRALLRRPGGGDHPRGSARRGTAPGLGLRARGPRAREFSARPRRSATAAWRR